VTTSLAGLPSRRASAFSLSRVSEGTPMVLPVVVPTTRTDFSNALHLEVNPPEGGLRERSFAVPEQLRAISHGRFSKRVGKVRAATLTELLRRCRLLLQESP
jgi:mRNA interferase MazF